MDHMSRILFNNDGTFILCNDAHERRPLTREDVLDYVDLMADTPVTTYLMCTNGSMPYYPSTLERALGCAEGTKHKAGKKPGILDGRDDLVASFGKAVRDLAAEGTDIVSLVMRRCREKGLEAFTSMRVNDLHFDDPNTCYPLVQSEFWLDHPEYRIGSEAIEGWNSAGALNFEHNAVREYKLALLQEMIERFQPDGHEVDLMRFPVYFPEKKAEACCPLMTDFIRKARRIVKNTSAVKGKDRLFGVRLPATVALCKNAGFDPQTWVREGLVDFITLATFFGDVPTLPVAEFKRALNAPTLPVYASLDCFVADPVGGWGLFRGCAANRWQEDADGLYFFNFFYHTLHGHNAMDKSLTAIQTDFCRSGPSRELLCELAAPEVLRSRNKIYNAGTRTGGYGVVQTFDLPDESRDGVLTFRLPMAEGEHRPEQAILFLRYLRGDPELQVSLNGDDCQLISANAGDYKLDMKLQTLEGLGTEIILAYMVDPMSLRDGENLVRVARPAGGEDIFYVRRADCVCIHGAVEVAGYF